MLKIQNIFGLSPNPFETILNFFDGFPYLEHDLCKLFLILLTKFLKNYGAELGEVDETSPGDGVGHVYHLLLHHVEAEADQGGQQVLHINARLPQPSLVLLEHHGHRLQLTVRELQLRHL